MNAIDAVNDDAEFEDAMRMAKEDAQAAADAPAPASDERAEAMAQAAVREKLMDDISDLVEAAQADHDIGLVAVVLSESKDESPFRVGGQGVVVSGSLNELQLAASERYFRKGLDAFYRDRDRGDVGQMLAAIIRDEE